MSSSGPITIQIDGAAKGNPGPAGVGVVLYDAQANVLVEKALFIGEATNNFAETFALVVALQEALALQVSSVKVQADSELLVRQTSGVYKIKDSALKTLHVLISGLVEKFEHFEIEHIPRVKNQLADKLANQGVKDGLLDQLKTGRKPKATSEPDPDEPSLF